MKRIIVCTLLICLVTGCTTKKMTCTKEYKDSGYSINSTYNFNYDDEVIKSANLKTTVILLSKEGKNYFELFNDYMKSYTKKYNDNNSVSTDISKSGSKSIMVLNVKKEGINTSLASIIGIESQTNIDKIKTMKKTLEKENFKCNY